MEKTKLQKTRTNKNLTQQQVADYLNMDVSNYNRKEKGKQKILQNEWEKLSQLFEVPIDLIYEPEESTHIVFTDNATGNYVGTNHFYSIPEYLLENQRKYIEMLEKENEILRNKIN